MNARANRLAHTLVELGVGRDVAVGVMLDRSFDLVVSFLAALKAGGCYVPLDPDYPEDRLAVYMEDSCAAVLITQQAHSDRAQKLGSDAAGWKVGMHGSLNKLLLACIAHEHDRKAGLSACLLKEMAKH